MAEKTRPDLSRCPCCKSFDVDRRENEEGGRSTDLCIRCGHSWTHTPGSITADQYQPDPQQYDENGVITPLVFPWDKKPPVEDRN